MRDTITATLGPRPVHVMFPDGDDQIRTFYVLTPDGFRIRVVECGDPQATDIVVCLHGWACWVYTFRVLMLLLADTGHRVIAIDLPGHGLSDAPDDPAAYTIDAMAKRVVQVTDVLSIIRATYIGHSMGGALAARIAKQHPERVKALVLCAPVGFQWTLPLRVASFLTPRCILPVLGFLAPRWIVPAVVRRVYGTLRLPTQRDYDEYGIPTQFPTFVRAVYWCLRRFDWGIGKHGGLDGITRPATILYGGKDPLVTERAARRYTRVITNSQLIDIPESGHVVPEEAPHHVAAAVLDVESRVTLDGQMPLTGE
jgi:pimeloyl-ACP methyl ester carboxylesterase